MAEVRWSVQAADNFTIILERLEDANPRAARIFAGRVKQITEQLQMFPLSGQVVARLPSDGVREIPIGSLRLIYFAFSESEVNILAIRPAFG